MEGIAIGRVIGYGLIVVIAAIYFGVRAYRRRRYDGYAVATVLRRENAMGLKPYQTRLVFEYEVEGVKHQGTVIRTADGAPQAGDTFYVQYRTDAPEKYHV